MQKIKITSKCFVFYFAKQMNKFRFLHLNLIFSFQFLQIAQM